MPKWIKSMNMAIQHVQGCCYVIIDIFYNVNMLLTTLGYKYAQHGFQMSVFKYEQHVILNKHIERLQPLEHI